MENASRQTNQEKVEYAAKEFAFLLIEHIEHDRKLNKKANKKAENKNGKSS